MLWIVYTKFKLVYTNFCGLIIPEDDIECESLTVISIDSLIVYDNKYLNRFRQLCL